MKTFKIFGIAVVLIGTILAVTTVSCSAEQVATYKNKSGAQLWGENCIRCHNTPSPAAYNDTDWSTISLHMRVRANLTKDQAKKIFDFIKSAN
ncbi:cytochrome c [Lutibacter sp.]|uniref:c-type cytochrome n=1 Tax=Lutibacter sp. TaxID=1925666 RepID=UPI0025C6A192|nr:cytochrome c [Lutibacter sp.]MCF6181190.1 cytochrome c [Lutibacter sp.]